MAKRSRPSNLPLIDFHFQLLLDLLQGRSEASEAVLLLQDTFAIMNAGAKTQIFQWHLKRVRGLVPDNTDILEAIDMLSECVIYREQL